MVFPILNSKAHKNTCSLFFRCLPGSGMLLVFLCLSCLAHLSLFASPPHLSNLYRSGSILGLLLSISTHSLMTLPSHMTFDIGWWLPHSYSSTELSPELQTCIFTCLVIISAQRTNRHLKLYISSLLSYSLPLFNKHQFHLSNWLDPKLCGHWWLISFTYFIYFISKFFEFYLKKISQTRLFFTTTTATTWCKTALYSPGFSL